MALQVKQRSSATKHKEQAIQDVLTQERVELNARIPKILHSEFKIACIRNNTTMTDLIFKWITDYVNCK